MLEQTELHLIAVSGLEIASPQPSEQVNTIDKRLIGRKTERHMARKIIVRTIGRRLKHVAILHKETQIRVVLTPEKAAVVGQITMSEGQREVYGDGVVVVIEVIGLPHTPSIAIHQSRNALHGVDDRGQKLTREATESTTAIVENKCRHSMRNLAEADSSYRCGHHIVDSRRLYFAQHLPHQTASQRVRHTLPEVEPTTAGTIEIKIAVVRMSEEVGRELVVVPHKAVTPVPGYTFKRDFGEVGLHHKAVEAVYQQVDTRGLQCRRPWMRL